MVAFAGCTDWNVDAEPYYPNGQSLSCYNPLPSTFPGPDLCSSPETTVALTGCIGVDDTDLSHTNRPSSLLPPPILNNLDEVSPEPMVALSGGTGVDGDMDVSCPQTIPSTLPPTFPQHSIDPDIPFPPNEPDNTLTSSPDPTVTFIGCTDVDSDVPQTRPTDPNYTLPYAEVCLSGHTYAEGSVNPPSNNNPLQAFHDKWSGIFTDPGNWPNFSEKCTAFC